jgi:ubiquinone biosynthesis protein
MGTLNEVDKHYLAQNFLAFFRRDYKRRREAHIESGWAPPDTRVDEFEAAIRAVCEPIFDKPLKEISFGKVLLRLFQTSRRFNIESSRSSCCCRRRCSTSRAWARARSRPRPVGDRQAVSRALDVGADRLARAGAARAQEAPNWTATLPQLPRLLHQVGSRMNAARPHGYNPAAFARPARFGNSTMLLWFVIAYLMPSIAIGIAATLRVHNTKDFVDRRAHAAASMS